MNPGGYNEATKGNQVTVQAKSLKIISRIIGPEETMFTKKVLDVE